MDERPALAIIALVFGVLLVAVVLADTFETIILPRGVTRGTGLTRVYYKLAWSFWRLLTRFVSQRRREGFLSGFGPISLPILLLVWAAGLVFGFGLIQWSIAELYGGAAARGLATELYMSGTTFFTLGIGDVTPGTSVGRWIVVIEAGVGFGFLALVIGYLPVLYGSFSKRETHISLLDSRASSPPTAGELLRRHGLANRLDELERLLRDWELWCAELLESHLSYPVLTYYRSQHDRQSWLASMAAILDTCALIKVANDDKLQWQAQLTFAMARHAVVDLTMVLDSMPAIPPEERLPNQSFTELRTQLAAAGIAFGESAEAEVELQALRRLYEPYLYALAEHLFLQLPPWFVEGATKDDWQTTAWDQEGHF